MNYNKKSKFGAKNHEFVMRFIRQNYEQKELPPYEYDEATGLVHVNGNFNCRKKKLKDFRGIKFGVIRGNFICSENEFKTMEGFPIEVHGNFECNHNRNIRSLIGAPKIVKGDFDVFCNKIESLEGCPSVIEGSFSCNGNRLTSLKFGPKKVNGDYNCDNNNITSLEGVPSKLENFDCSYNELTNLVGAPLSVKNKFTFYQNKITSLVGAPIAEKYDFSNNLIDSFEGLPDSAKVIDASDNRLNISSLKSLPPKVKSLAFDNNDPFLEHGLCERFIEFFLETRSIEISVAKFKQEIIECSKGKVEEALDRVERKKRELKELLKNIKEVKKELAFAEENYKKIKETNIEDYVTSFANKELQKGVSTLGSFGII
jgi:hypothetical protein